MPEELTFLKKGQKLRGPEAVGKLRFHHPYNLHCHIPKVK